MLNIKVVCKTNTNYLTIQQTLIQYDTINNLSPVIKKKVVPALFDTRALRSDDAFANDYFT